MLHEIQLEFSLRATKMSNEENSPSNDNYWQQLFEYQYPRYDVSIDCLQSPFESKKSMAIKIDEDHEHRQAKRKRSLRIDPKRLRLLRLLMEDRNMNAMNIANVQEQSIKQVPTLLISNLSSKFQFYLTIDLDRSRTRSFRNVLDVKKRSKRIRFLFVVTDSMKMLMLMMVLVI